MSEIIVDMAFEIWNKQQSQQTYEVHNTFKGVLSDWIKMGRGVKNEKMPTPTVSSDHQAGEKILSFKYC